MSSTIYRILVLSQTQIVELGYMSVRGYPHIVTIIHSYMAVINSFLKKLTNSYVEKWAQNKVN